METTTSETVEFEGIGGARISDKAAIRRFLLAGNAYFTLRSLTTGSRFTFRVSRADGEDAGRPWFVALLRGASNESDYSYLGTIFPAGTGFRFVHGRKSKISKDAPSARAFEWFASRLASATDFPGTFEFWHEGRCCRCGRRLTVPESIASGVGPDCAGRV